MKENLLRVTHMLKEVHRRFLELERLDAEKFFERRISPFDFLQILTHDKNFKWLQPFSALIAELDAFLEESENVSDEDLVCMKDQIAFVLRRSVGDSFLYDRYQTHLNNDPNFVLLHANLNEALNRLKPTDISKNLS
ncbi:hypothetical protein QJS83_14125 [Bdellovibrio sp. 22V]|uniref:hypothetical protein n=1 Tax=Bdellovibrio TaxID=958 RepID=UPI0025432F5C|nr:hypothetical protein [Bdellovibrio sp. 22V]WII71603.1 hypothetical protein QJS83_14125 [Bdellovibrio sp. 22V]